jgi:alpha-galactosidase
MKTIKRRTVLQVASSTAALGLLPAARAADTADKATLAVAEDGRLSIGFDSSLRTSIRAGSKLLAPWQASENLLLAAGPVDSFTFLEQRTETLSDAAHGAGRRTIVKGRSNLGLVKEVHVDFFERYAGFALLQATYRNTGTQALDVKGWRNAAHELGDAPGGFWSFSGTTHEDRRDWVQPVKDGFEQPNSLAMVESDYGGGTPVANLWRRDAGLAVGHVETVPRLLSLPVRKTARGARIAVECARQSTLKSGETLKTDLTFLCAHTGDHFAPLALYQRYMQDGGIAAQPVPQSAFGAIWCAWGYERNFTTEQVLATLPKVRDMGFEWAVLDDGWQNNEGDWHLDKSKFPRGDADMKAFADAVRAQGMRPRLWLAPLAADPGSDVLHDHADMLLLDQDGAVQKVSWWNAFTQCPAYQPTVDYYVALTRKIIGEWGFEGLKLDGQHLNSVAPCFNPAHKHARPTDSVEKLADFWMAIHKAAHDINPNAVIELCPCGTAFAFHNLPATDQYPSSDPLSSWQVRSKGKSVKALMGRGSSYAGDHVELSDGGNDFASSVGVGAVISTKFTWPRDTDNPTDKLPPGGFALTAEREALWRKWVGIYQQHMLSQGEYRGALYDIGFDRPEAHAIAKDGAMYYAFYADQWKGPLQLRGLGPGSYRVRDLFNEVELGMVDARANTLDAKFEKFLLLRATPASTG